MDSRNTHEDWPPALRSAAGKVWLAVSLSLAGALGRLTWCVVAQLLGNYVDVDIVAKYANSSEIIT